MERVRLKPKEERRLLRGHLWVYRNELEGAVEAGDGDVVDVFSDHGRFVGRGFFQKEGGIAVRILLRRQEPIDGGFLADRIDAARQFREKLFPGQTVYRWVFGESDGLPGLVADRYDRVVSAETPCRFYEAHLDLLGEAFLAYPGVESVRVTVAGRKEPARYGTAPASLECEMDGLRAHVDIESGQKTGLFLDQRINSNVIRPYAAQARVLDAHCYVGIWSCRAALAGASSVLGVDTSAHAIERARANAQLNGVEGVCRFEAADVAEVLRRGAEYDLIILDPPALAKSRAQEGKALALYHALNRDAMQAVAPGGVLVTASCSHFVTREAFLEVLKRAATAARRQVWILEVRGASPDHPVLMAMPETAYLTCVILRLL